MKYSKIPLAQTVVTLCKVKGIKHIVISPGSRNAPLTISFTHDPFFTCYSIVDERSAGFFALGIAQKIEHPVALVCTSGSALLNYYPAIAEAYYSDIPLAVLSADRPKHLVGIGDGQTINQKEVYGSHVLYHSNLKLDLDDKDEFQNDDLPILKNIENKLETYLALKKSIEAANTEAINNAFNTAIKDKGPVHLNIPFAEPLYELTETLSVNPIVMDDEVAERTINDEVIEELTEIWNSKSRKLVLVGVNSPNAVEEKWLNSLANDPSVIVFTETTSNIHHHEFFPSIDQIIAPLNEDGFKVLQPDILLTFGGMVVSKKIKAFLRSYKPKEHWHVDLKKANDTFFSLTKHIPHNPNTFFREFSPKIQPQESDYKFNWSAVKAKRKELHKTYVDTIPFSDFKVFDIILKAIPDFYILQVGNSSAIRYTQLFDINPTLKVYCNRGTSGIDGSTSTAVGYASVSETPTVFITGDLSFFYDANGLWNNYKPSTFRIIIVNNEGGGIFRILPGNKNSENFDRYFETKHTLNAKHLSDMHNIEYVPVDSEVSLVGALHKFFEPSSVPKILEVKTPSTENDEILLNYFKVIA